MHVSRSAFTLRRPSCVNMGAYRGVGGATLFYIYEEVSEVLLTQKHLVHIKITFGKT